MSNVEFYLPAVDGSEYRLVSKGDSCKEAIHNVLSDDWAAPPRGLVIKVMTESGKELTVRIPYSHDGRASVQIDGEPL